ISHFHVTTRYSDATLLDMRIETGRTHQIRVHLAFIGHPVVGDGVYGNKTSERLADELGVTRQVLHAASLGFRMPGSDEVRTFTAPLPNDMVDVLEKLTESPVEENHDA